PNCQTRSFVPPLQIWSLNTKCPCCPNTDKEPFVMEPISVFMKQCDLSTLLSWILISRMKLLIIIKPNFKNEVLDPTP
ncbi:17622_t:CDS:1, partial [Cetraspora pellucida]